MTTTKANTSDVKTLREQPVADLQAQVQQLRQEMWEHRLKSKEGALQQTHLIRVARRQVARLQTLLREKQEKSA